MTKRIFTLTFALLALSLTLAFTGVTAYAGGTVNVTIDGRQVIFPDNAPVIVDSRTLVPVRAVFESLAFNVSWDGAAQQVTLRRTDHTVVLTIDSDRFTTNGVSHSLDVPAQVIGGSTMLPIRAVLESVNYEVDWDGATGTVMITAYPAPAPEPANENAAELARRVFILTNAERVKHGLSPLIWHDGLAEAARAHNEDQAKNRIESHIGSDGSQIQDRVDKLDLDYRSVGENLGFGHITPEAVVEGWMTSVTGHRELILAELYQDFYNPDERPFYNTHLGVSFYRLDGSNFENYWNQTFGRFD